MTKAINPPSSPTRQKTAAVSPHPTPTIHATNSRDTTTAPNKASSGRPANPASGPWSTKPAVNPAEYNAAR